MTKRGARLYVEVDRVTLGLWKGKAARSGMTLSEWAERSLNAAPVLRVLVMTVDETKAEKKARP